MSNFSISTVTTLRIASSGHGDRYVMATTRYVIEKRPGFRVYAETREDAADAFLTLTNTDLTEEHYIEFQKLLRASPRACWIHYEANGGARGTVPTTPQRIRAGVDVATGRHLQFRAAERERAEKLAAELTANEWRAVRTGLEEVNREQARFGRPVVEFAIPDIA